MTDIKEEEPEDESETVDQGDIKDEDITALMEYSKCSRNKAIKILK